MNNKVNDKDYIKLTPFKGWVLENFPFIESDFDCITNYQLLCKITEYLNNVISNQNQVQQLGTELVTAYNQLLDYVNNYFNNLDVQEEVNNKLDEMAEDGSLTNLIKAYVDPLYQAYENTMNNQYNNFTQNINSRVNTINAKVDSVTSGSPLVASSTSGMTDTTRIYVNTTDGYWYYYNGSAWTQGGVYQSTGIGSETIHLNNLDTSLKDEIYNIKTTINELYGTFPNVDKYSYLYSDGSINYDQTNERVVTIKTPLKAYKGDTLQAPEGYQICICEYSSSNPSSSNLLHYSNYITNGNPYTIQSDECYILITFGYVSGSTEIADSSIIYNIIFNFYSSRNNKQDEEITYLNSLTSNLTMNLTTINEIYGVFPNVAKYCYLTATGEVAEASTNERIVTIRTPLLVHKEDTLQAPEGYQIAICEYSSDEPSASNLVHYSGYITNGNPYTIQSDECYILITFGYVSGSTEIADVNIIQNIIFNIKVNSIDYLLNKEDINNGYVNNRFYRNIIKNFVDVYYKGLNSNYNSKEFNRNTTYKYLIQCFNELKNQNSSYITKNDLGVATGVDSDNNQYRIYEYVISNNKININNNGWNKVKYPKILIIQGQHGFEKSNVYGMYYFLYDLIYNYDKNPVLAFIRENVEIHLIPVVVPYAWDNNTYYNANGVAGNRNYDMPGWVQGSVDNPDTYGGAYPFSEPETRIVRDFVRRNKDAILFIDSHTNGQYSVATYNNINWISLVNLTDSYYVNIANVVKSHLNQINSQFRKEYNLDTNEFIGNVTLSTNDIDKLGGYADCWVTVKENIIGLTLEGFNGFPNQTSYQPDVFKANSEIIGNFIIKFLLYFSNI